MLHFYDFQYNSQYFKSDFKIIIRNHYFIFVIKIFCLCFWYLFYFKLFSPVNLNVYSNVFKCAFLNIWIIKKVWFTFEVWLYVINFSLLNTFNCSYIRRKVCTSFFIEAFDFYDDTHQLRNFHLIEWISLITAIRSTMKK